MHKLLTALLIITIVVTYTGGLVPLELAVPMIGILLISSVVLKHRRHKRTDSFEQYLQSLNDHWTKK